MTGEIQLSRHSNTQQSIASKIFIAAIVLSITNIALSIFSIAEHVPLELLSVATPIMTGIIAILHVIFAVCSCIGITLITCRKHTIGCRTITAIRVFCISLTLSTAFLCVTEIVSANHYENIPFEIVKICTMVFGFIVIMIMLNFFKRLYTLTSNPPLFFISERIDNRIQENIYEDIRALKARGRTPPLPVALPINRNNSIGTIYEEIPLQSEESSMAYIDAFGSQEDMRTAMTNV